MPLDSLVARRRSVFSHRRHGFCALCITALPARADCMHVILLVVAMLLGMTSGAQAQRPEWIAEGQTSVMFDPVFSGSYESPALQYQQPAVVTTQYSSSQPEAIPMQSLGPQVAPAYPLVEALPITERAPEIQCDLPVVSPTAAERCWGVGGLVRGYYRNDQRIEWSGMEESFGAEGVVAPMFRQQLGAWETKVEGEFYINQPFDQNILADTAERRSYFGNFHVDTFEISKLLISCRRDDFSVTLGKMETPFGRYYFPLYTNARIDAPFIRTESILWRETGLDLRWQPGCFVGDVAITNGLENLDSNSSKAVMSRIGLQNEYSALGFSLKFQDGIGSEQQKEFKNHVGADAMVRFGQFQLSGECIYDEFGFRRPGFDPDDITWYRSIYYRDMNRALNVPCTGVGYYVNLGYKSDYWNIDLNYGEFYPTPIGDPQHDEVNRRGIVKAAYSFTPVLQPYCAVLVENSGFIAQEDRPRKGLLVLSGLQYVF
jgi:hypothetical protein